MTKVNIGTEIRQAYEQGWREADIAAGQQACYERTRWVLGEYFGLSGTRTDLWRERLR